MQTHDLPLAVLCTGRGRFFFCTDSSQRWSRYSTPRVFSRISGFWGVSRTVHRKPVIPLDLSLPVLLVQMPLGLSFSTSDVGASTYTSRKVRPLSACRRRAASRSFWYGESQTKQASSVPESGLSVLKFCYKENSQDSGDLHNCGQHNPRQLHYSNNLSKKKKNGILSGIFSSE